MGAPRLRRLSRRSPSECGVGGRGTKAGCMPASKPRCASCRWCPGGAAKAVRMRSCRCAAPWRFACRPWCPGGAGGCAHAHARMRCTVALCLPFLVPWGCRRLRCAGALCSPAVAVADGIHAKEAAVMVVGVEGHESIRQLISGNLLSQQAACMLAHRVVLVPAACVKRACGARARHLSTTQAGGACHSTLVCLRCWLAVAAANSST